MLTEMENMFSPLIDLMTKSAFLSLISCTHDNDDSWNTVETVELKEHCSDLYDILNLFSATDRVNLRPSFYM